MVVQSLSVSMISKYISQVKPIPNAGIKESDCVFNVSLTESMDGFQLAIFSNNINAIGNSSQGGMKGLTQSLLRALYRSKDDSQLKNKICSEYSEMMSDDCKPIGAVVLFYNDRGE